MNTIEIEACEHPFLKGMPERHQHALLENATTAKYAKGDILFRQGDPANRFYLIEDGGVALEACSPKHRTVHIHTLGEGDVLGWSWLFEPFVWNFQARAVEPTTVLVLDAAHLLRLSNENHEFGYDLMKKLARVVIGRLQATRRRLLELADAGA